MIAEQLQLLRDWVKAEIEYALASREEGSDGYRQSARGEREMADRCFANLLSSVGQQAAD